MGEALAEAGKGQTAAGKAHAAAGKAPAVAQKALAAAVRCAAHELDGRAALHVEAALANRMLGGFCPIHGLHSFGCSPGCLDAAMIQTAGGVPWAEMSDGAAGGCPRTPAVEAARAQEVAGPTVDPT